jgi:hypothetical protein
VSVEAALNQDFLDLLEALRAARAEFLVVGAHALAAAGVVRATGDLDVWVRPSEENAARVVAALRRFGAPLAQHGVSEADFIRRGTVYQLGLPPRRIDLMTEISGVEFEAAWAGRFELTIQGHLVAFLGREALLANKRAAGRDKDLLDVQLLERGAARR